MVKKKRLTLHDRFAKVSLQEKPIALDFFKTHLPQKIQEIIDWKTLELQPGVFIDEDYQARYTDILYRVEMDKQPGYLFVLTEHQSKVRRESCIDNCLTLMRPAMLLAVIYQYMRSWQRLGVKLLGQCTSAFMLIGNREGNYRLQVSM